MINSIDLSNYEFAFSDSQLDGLKSKNFIYGKNGTGKSSLVDAIKEQYSGEYDIKVFDGWSGIIKENDYLDAIALGEINVSKQTEIDKIDKKTKEIDEKILEPQDEAENLFKRRKKAESTYNAQKRKIESFYTKSGTRISSLLSLGRTYDKRNFKEDITLANTLSESEISKLNETIKAEKILQIKKIFFPKIELEKYLEATNEILQTVVLPSGVINEVINNREKQNFAKLGMEIHSRERDDELCSFCGSVISKARWEELDRYFSDEVKKLDARVLRGIENIEKCIVEVDNISSLDENQFYPEYKDSIQELNVEILSLKSDYGKFLKVLKDALEDKKGQTTEKISKIQESIPLPFSNIQVRYDTLYSDNNNYSINLNQEQETAKKKIRLHEVKIDLDNFKYSDEILNLKKLETEQRLLTDEISALEDTKGQLVEERKILIADMTKEVMTATNINRFLKGLGSQSFSLDHIKSADGQKGQYRVLDAKANERSIQTLSDGEKNIVAFLWFIDSLESEPADGQIKKERIVIFDDPMNSNDDSCQYLMIGVIQKFYRKERHPQLFLMTHNTHFYLQVTPNSKKYPSHGKSPEQNYLRFMKTEDKTSIFPILDESSNLKTIYDELWEELKFAYKYNKVIFMWNNMRRILETYNRFYFKNGSPSEIENKFDDSVDKVLAIALIKSLNVNSHVGYETDIDISGKTRDELKNIFFDVFDKLDAGRHFKSYWSL